MVARTIFFNSRIKVRRVRLFSSWLNISTAGQQVLKFSQSEALQDKETAYSGVDSHHVRPSQHVNSKPRFPLCKSSKSIIWLQRLNTDDLLISSYTWETPVQTSRRDQRKSSPGQSSGASANFSKVFQFPPNSAEAPDVIRIWGPEETTAQTSHESRDELRDDTETWKAGWDLCRPSDPSDEAWGRSGVFQRRAGQFHPKPRNSDSITAAR